MFSKIKEIIDVSNDIYIIGHKGPDGDAIGSSFSLCIALNNLGKNAKVIMPAFSDSFKFLPGIESSVSKVDEDSYDLLIAVDSSDRSRLPISDEDFNKAKKVVMIDHHEIGKNPYGDERYIDSTMPAACEII